MFELILGLISKVFAFFKREITVSSKTQGFEKLNEEIIFENSSDEFNELLTWRPLQDWLQNFDYQCFQLQSISIKHVYRINGRVLFALLEVCCLRKSDQALTKSCIFMRGKSVAVLLEVVDFQDPSKTFFALVSQDRLPVGRSKFIELPAGMRDDKDIKGQAVQELREELGVNIDVDDLKSLGSFYPSPGGSDEEIHLFYYRVALTSEKIKEMLSKTHGNDHENESIQVVLMTLEEIKSAILDGKIQDSKLIIALFMRTLQLGSHS